MRVRLPSGSYTQLDVRGSASVLDLKRLLVQVRLRPARRAAHVAGLPLDSVGLRCTYHSNRTTYYVLLYKVPPRVSTAEWLYRPCVSQDQTIAAVQESGGVQPSRQTLVHQFRALQDDGATLASCGVCKGAVLCVAG